MTFSARMLASVLTDMASAFGDGCDRRRFAKSVVDDILIELAVYHVVAGGVSLIQHCLTTQVRKLGAKPVIPKALVAVQSRVLSSCESGSMEETIA